MSSPAAARIPVIIGVGQINDRPSDPAQGLDSLGLMRAALHAAERDSGSVPGDRIDYLGVVDQLSFPDPDIHTRLAATLARRPARVVRTPDASGDGPLRLLGDAANLIASGAVSVAAIVGGEAMRTANKRAQMAAMQAAQAGGPASNRVDKLAEAATAGALPHTRPYGLLTPSDIYPLYEQATRVAWGQSMDEAQRESAAIWAGNAQVAAASPDAWLRTPRTAAEIMTPDADNRMISFPYTKLMVANDSVNQGAAVIVASLATAQALGIAPLVFVGRGAAAHEPDDYLRRDSFARSASMAAVLDKVLAVNELTIADIDHVELYSCFPCIPKMARRELGWPLDRPHSIYGGLTFGGAPVGNCMMHALAALTQRLRRPDGGTHGLIFANGGYASHNHAVVLGRTAGVGAGQPHAYDVQAEAERRRGAIPAFIDDHVGPAVIETYMMPYDRKGAPRFATIVGRTPAGARFLAHVPGSDAALLGFLAGADGEPVGSAGVAVAMPDGRTRWTRRS